MQKASVLAVGGIMCLIGAWRAIRGALAPRVKLLEMSERIGTKSPVLARLLCWVGFLPLALAGFGLLLLSGLFAFRVID